MSQQGKDPIINVRATSRLTDLKGRDVFEVKIGGKNERDAGQIDALINALVAIKENPNGVKLKFYTQKKEYQGRQFDSTFFFVAPVQEGGFGPRAAAPAGQRYKTTPVVAQPANTAAAAASLKKPAV